MLKQLILLFHLISMSFVTFLLSDGIEISSTLPTELVKDSTYIIEVTIKKGDLFGFAKYQQDFPEGFEAKPVETAEASFTFADGKMKFIWMALPETQDVKISYAITALAGAPAESLVSGKFSYIFENERKSYDIPNVTVKVISDEEAAPKVPAMATVNRTITPLGGNKYQIDLAIQKQGIYGFSKLEEYLPAGADAEIIEGNKSVFSQVDEKAKFVWMSIPENQTLNVSYTVSASQDVLAELQSMEGSFAFLDENETKTVAILGASVYEAAAIAVAEEPEAEQIETPTSEMVESPIEEVAAVVPENEVEQVTTTQPEVEAPIIAEAVAPKEPVAQTAAKPVTEVPAPETGVTYKVQIAAGKKLVEDAFIKKTYKFDEQFAIENHDGWIKYITGQFPVYKAARDKRESLVAAQHNFPGPFVTAYNDGERITVQEALMITNQQWFK